jgi:hypothetical protein
MFSYYGSKSKIVKYYPKPAYDKIIEPFAGSARYSLLYFEKDVTLIDKYKDIVEMWRYLQVATEKDILGFLKLKLDKAIDIRNLNLSNEEKLFLSFNIQRSSDKRYRFSGWGIKEFKYTINRVAKNLYKIRHWKILNGSYEEVENSKATWFIDPPYQYGGEHYRESNKNIDFTKLKGWCQSRKGQIIVCENSKANWMDFKPMVKIQGMSNTFTTECIWSNLPTQYDSNNSLF